MHQLCNKQMRSIISPIKVVDQYLQIEVQIWVHRSGTDKHKNSVKIDIFAVLACLDIPGNGLLVPRNYHQFCWRTNIALLNNERFQCLNASFNQLDSRIFPISDENQSRILSFKELFELNCSYSTLLSLVWLKVIRNYDHGGYSLY